MDAREVQQASVLESTPAFHFHFLGLVCQCQIILNEKRPRGLGQPIQYGSEFHENDATTIVKDDTCFDRCLERRRATTELDELRSVRYEFIWSITVDEIAAFQRRFESDLRFYFLFGNLKSLCTFELGRTLRVSNLSGF